MFVRTKSTPNSSRVSVQICESRRVGDSVKQVIVRYVGVAMDERELDALKQLAESIRVRLEAERSASAQMFSPEEAFGRRNGGKRKGRKPRASILPVDEVRLKNLVEEGRVIEGIHEVFGPLYDEFGFSRLLGKPHLAKALKAVVLARIANPQSKHRTAALLEEEFGVRVSLDAIYEMMDEVTPAVPQIQKYVYDTNCALFPGKVDVLFFDVTTLYFESITQDELREFGYSKDQKFHSVQVVLAMATTQAGLPVGYRLFKGNTGEVKTLIECLKDWRQHIDIANVSLVADRAMMCKENLALLEKENVEYVVAASLRKMPEDIRTQVLDAAGYRLANFEEDMSWAKEISVNHRRLIATYSSQRARKDVSDRKRILENLNKRLGKKKAPLKKLVSNQGHLKFAQTAGNASVEISEDKVQADAAWDGMHGLITNSNKSIPELLARYRRLWTIEAAFRVNKHDLRMRPIFHWKPQRIEAHIAICFMAYALLQYARYRVSLQQVRISPEGIRNELLRVQASILRDKTTGGRYRLPSNMSIVARSIYRALHIDRSLTPQTIDL